MLSVKIKTKPGYLIQIRWNKKQSNILFKIEQNETNDPDNPDHFVFLFGNNRANDRQKCCCSI